MSQAFEGTRYVSRSEKEVEVIAASDLSGTLEKAFARIAYETGEKLSFRMQIVTTMATRITLAKVISSIIMLVMGMIL